MEKRGGGVGAHGVRIHAVDHEIVVGYARAVYRNVLGVPADGGVVGQVGGGAGRQPQDLREITRRERKLVQGPLIHYAAGNGRRGLDQCGLRYHGDLFAGLRGDLHGDIDARRFGDAHLNVRDRDGLEAGRAGHHVVGSGGQQGKQVRTRVAGDRFAMQAGRAVQFHLGGGDAGAAGVGDGPEDLTGSGSLSGQRRRRKQRRNQKTNNLCEGELHALLPFEAGAAAGRHRP